MEQETPPDWQQRATEWVHLLQNSSSLRGILEELVSVLPWRVIGFYRIVEGQNRIVAEVSKGYEAIRVPHLEFPLTPENNSLVSYCFARKHTIWLGAELSTQIFNLGARSKEIIDRLNLEKAVAIPLIHGGLVVGVIYIADGAMADLSEAAVKALESIAPILASMISRQRLIEIMENENQAFHWMQEMSRVLLFVRNEEELWWQFRDMLIQLGKVTGGAYLVRHEHTWHVHDIFGILAPYRDRLGTDMVKWVEERIKDNWEERRITWTRLGVRILPDNVQGESEYGRGLRYYVGDAHELSAVMIMYFDNLDSSVSRLLPSLLQMYNLAFQVIRQREELEHLSTHDALTGLGNRRAFEEYMEAYFQSAVKPPALLLLCDLDGFKRLNDTHGHQQGDQALREVAKFLLDRSDQNQMACRFGGDEFVLVTLGEEWNSNFPQRLSRLLKDSPLAKYELSATVGVVELPRESQDFTESYRLADERLYQGKRSGKNCLVGPTGVVSLEYQMSKSACPRTTSKSPSFSVD